MENSFTKKRCYYFKSRDERAMIERYCPLIKGNCRGPRCIAFQEASFLAIDDKQDKYRYYRPVCKSFACNNDAYVEITN